MPEVVTERARRMFEGLLPPAGAIAAIEGRFGVEFLGICEAVHGVGGDHWGVEVLGDERFAVFTADCAGKGLEAAFNVFRLNSLMRTLAAPKDQPDAVLAALDHHFHALLARGDYVTMVYGVVDLRADRFTYSAAGTPSPLVAIPESSGPVVGDGSGLPLGIAGNAVYELRECRFRPGDMLVLCTDGLSGRKDDRGRRLGDAGLAGLFANPQARSWTRPRMTEVVTAPGHAVEDDIAVLCCLRTEASIMHPVALGQNEGHGKDIAASPSMPSAGRKVLIVDDEEGMREVLADILDLEGFSTIQAGSGEEALSHLAANGAACDAILLDKNMPGMDGFDFLRRLKGTEALKGIPVIIATGAKSTTDMIEGISAGAYYYLTKPIDYDVLITVVRSAIKERETYAHLREDITLNIAALTNMTHGEFCFRTPDEAGAITTMLAQLCPRPQKVLVGLIELLINAVEHGILGIGYDGKSQLLTEGRLDPEIRRRLEDPAYAEKGATVAVERTADAIRFHIRDYGPGFDWERYLDFDPERLTDAHGRGIAMARLQSFDGLQYLGNGNEVVATVRLNGDSPNNGDFVAS